MVARRADERPAPVFIYRRWCKGCGICIEFCPRDVLKAGQDGQPVVAQADRCTLCRLCEILCPDFSIAVARRDKVRKE
jgi:2-oxoglutarate ferredoxin oxidoreductase subunit delta